MLQLPGLTPVENLQLGQWIRLCHIILAGACTSAADGGGSGYGVGFNFPHNPGGVIGDILTA